MFAVVVQVRWLLATSSRVQASHVLKMWGANDNGSNHLQVPFTAT